jgi:prophage regulatory protein
MSKTTVRLISMKVVEQLTSYSRTEIGRLEKAGKFPKRIRMSAHPRGRIAYPEDEVQDWIIKRIRERSP